MKIFIPPIKESWIIDRVNRDWKKYNKGLSTPLVNNADILWINAPWIWEKIAKKYLERKKVVCSIYHFEKSDLNYEGLRKFNFRDQYIDSYHTISDITKSQLSKLTKKPIHSFPFWINQDFWYEIPNKSDMRKKYGFSENDYIIGSFQRDTEGSDLVSPKLIKGPDRFLEIVANLYSKNKDLKVLLAGKRRQYLIRGLQSKNIPFKYFEMVSNTQLNHFYNILNLYIVTSRIEGGPQAIAECGITKTPIISTNVGMATKILAKESIFNMSNYLNAKPNVEVAFKNSEKLIIPHGMDPFIKMFKSL